MCKCRVGNFDIFKAFVYIDSSRKFENIFKKRPDLLHKCATRSGLSSNISSSYSIKLVKFSKPLVGHPVDEIRIVENDFDRISMENGNVGVWSRAEDLAHFFSPRIRNSPHFSNTFFGPNCVIFTLHCTLKNYYNIYTFLRKLFFKNLIFGGWIRIQLVKNLQSGSLDLVLSTVTKPTLNEKNPQKSIKNSIVKSLKQLTI